MKPDLILVDTTEEYAVEPGRAIRQQPGEYNLDYLMRRDTTGAKARAYVLWLESVIQARERTGTDANLLSCRNALEFYASKANWKGEEPEATADAGNRARIALAAID